MNSVKTPASADKDVQRRFYKEKRKVLLKNKEQKERLDSEIQSRLILTREYREAKAILVYAARDFEIATSMIINAAFANNKTVALPRCEDDATMGFYIISSFSDLAEGYLGIKEPVTGCEPFIPDESSLCVCPCLCCDMSGYRLGFGAGYYDRWLKNYPGRSAVLCYSDAVVPAIKRDESDVPVDLIVTDSFVRRTKGYN